MKRISIFFVSLTLLVFTHSASFAQIRKIPAEVTDAFSAKYAEATGVEWKDRLTGFTANFTLDNTVYRANFDNDGEWESTEQDIETEELPDSVKNGFDKSKYTDWEMISADKIELPGDEWQYRIEVGKGDIKKRNLLFNSKGRLLKDKLTL